MEKTSAFMLLFRNTHYNNLSPNGREAMLEQWNAWYDGLAAAGKVEQAHPLDPEGRVVSGSRGERVVDGPFAEAKEAIGGYFFLNVADIEEATEVARGCPGLPHGVEVEVRPVAMCCHVAKSLGRTTMRAPAGA